MNTLEERIVSCLPAATFEMETLCRLAGVEASREVPTAAVTCEGRPRMLVNPDFVREHCVRDEHLFLLVMHELYHVILGHTRLYPRPTAAHNIAFDAVINAGLMREFHGESYLGFFDRLNPPDSFPGLLLRPPPGWPWQPAYAAGVGPDGTEWIMQRLYPALPPPWSRLVLRNDFPTYQELLELLAKGNELGDNFLLGDHGGGDSSPMDDPLFGDVVRRIVARWPPPPFPLGGRDVGGQVSEWLSALAPCPHAVRGAFAAVLRRALGPYPGEARRRGWALVEGEAGQGVLPNPHDRMAAARRRLGLPTTLWRRTTPVPARVLAPIAAAHVYLDVSGSMSGLLPYLLGLLRPYVEHGQARVFQFSTAVRPLALRDLVARRLYTTQGTDIDCVFEHLLAEPRVRRALVLTDGYTGKAKPRLAAGLARSEVRLHVVMPAESAWRGDLEPVATSITVLPPLYSAAAPWRI